MTNLQELRSPKTLGFYQPAEWITHQACWLAWPSHANLWKESLPGAQQEFIQLCRAITDVDPKSGQARGESLEVLVPDEQSLQDAQKALEGLPVRFHRIPFGDIWLRDTAPLFLLNSEGRLGSVRFSFNGWGEKYQLPHDPQVAERIAGQVDVPHFSFPWILEGGSVDVDGEGTCLTTRQCLLNPNRNSKMTEGDVEQGLQEALGVNKVLWLNEGLLNDHTDGHIDTLARFVGPATVVCMKAEDPETDPNFEVLEEIARDLSQMKDAKGRPLNVIRVASPGKVLSAGGDILPASYVNFYIGNSTVVVPTYGVPNDAKVVEQLSKIFPGRRVIGSSAISILSGGGAFHCITQQQPKGA